MFTENNDVTILKMSDTVIKDRKEKRCMFIDLEISSRRNTSVKVTEKLSKYNNQETLQDVNRTDSLESDQTCDWLSVGCKMESLINVPCF